MLMMAFVAAMAGAQGVHGVQLLCHRTANQDVPENTLESLEQAALLGCNVVEIDLRKTLDGRIVLNHDGILERLTDGVGEVETSYYEDLEMRDAGSWMGDRFMGLRVVLFEDALRMARERDIRLVLDIKTKGIGVDVLELLQREGMLEHVQFNGEWDDVKKLYSGATNAGDGTAWVQPGVTAEQVREFHHQGKAVVANFSANGHEMDLAGMKAAVAAGVDGINVDYPRLGADAVGRPVERRLKALVEKARASDSALRAAAILDLSRYRGLALESEFARWLLDPEDRVSRAAAVALVKARPQTPAERFSDALRSEHSDARANAAWALGMLGAPASMLQPLLRDSDPRVLQETLMALGRMPGEVQADQLLPLLENGNPAVRGAAAVALARHQPETALRAIPGQLRLEKAAAIKLGQDYERRGRPHLSRAEIEEITGHFRCQMKMMQALSSLKVAGAKEVLLAEAFRPGNDSAQMDAIVAAFQLWDRIGTDTHAAIEALGSSDSAVADRTEWMLVQAGSVVLPEVRKALESGNSSVRERAIRIVAWQGDVDSVERLKAKLKTGSDPAKDELIAWAIDKIETLHPAGGVGSR
jgi:glycerophosphoryl diester phosphodiesterase/HEAT repeat protein